MASKVIQSQTTLNTPDPIARSLKRQKFVCSDGEDTDTTPRKLYRRVSKACERCRLKKTKCDGEIPCQRCTNDLVVCCEGARKRGKPKTVAESCLELLEYQQNKFIAGHLMMYKMMVDAGIWSFGEIRKNNRGMPVVHDILEKLGILRLGTEFPHGFPESPDENRALRRQVEAIKAKDEYTYDFQIMTSDSSPPSLIYTDREGSIETCSSEVNSSIKINFNALTPSHIVNQNLGFPQDSNKSHWTLELEESENNEDSVAAQTHFTVPSSTNTLSYNQKQQLNSSTPLYSEMWSRCGLETDHPITRNSCPRKFTPHFSIQSHDKYDILINSQALSNNQPNLMSLNIFDQMEMNNEIMPIGMKYTYDHYMN